MTYAAILWFSGCLAGIGFGWVTALLYVRRFPQHFSFVNHIMHHIKIAGSNGPQDDSEAWKRQ